LNSSYIKKCIIRLGIVFTGLIIGFIIHPKLPQKYIGKLLSGTNQLLADGQRIEYIDIDGDGLSEEFIYYHLSDNRQPVINQYSNNGEFKNVWYLDGKVAENFDFIAGDYNNDGIKEVFVFSYDKNCLCLYGLNPESSNRFISKKVSIHQFVKNIDNRHIVIHAGGIADLNSDGFGEVVFSINSRYSNTPRRVYAYDIVNDTLLKSPELGWQLVGSPIIYDIDNDGLPEIFLSTLNNTNQAWVTPQNQALYSASVVLQHDLSYYFVPVLFESRMSVSTTFPVTLLNKKYIGTLSWSLRNDNKSRLMLINNNGKVIQRKKLTQNSYVFDPKRNYWNDLLLFSHKGFVFQYNNSLVLNKKTSLKGPINQVAFIDVDSDNNQEFVVVQNNKLAIYRNDFSSPVTIDIPGLNVQKVYFSVKKNRLKRNLLSVQNKNQQYLISYVKNKYYWLPYLVYLSSILVIFLIYFLLRKIHFKKVERVKSDNENFFSMQMELIRNQLDPHFLFNALNSISFSINKDERKIAYHNLGLFSKFLRESIISLEDFSRSLEEELDYVQNYLTLEKFRFKDKFDYDFIVGPGVNKAQKVPKLILFSFIESALKKGVLPKNTGGRIEIIIDTFDVKGIYLMIADTGLHRGLETSEVSHTKNMLMMKRIAFYFNQYNLNKIEIKLKDNGTPENPKGSSVEITIPPDYQYIL